MFETQNKHIPFIYLPPIEMNEHISIQNLKLTKKNYSRQSMWITLKEFISEALHYHAPPL